MAVQNYLTNLEKAFVKHYVGTGNAQYAAHKAGYALPESGSAVANRPKIREVILREQQARITNELVPLALDTLQELLSNKETPASARVAAVKVVLDRGLGDSASVEAREPHEMTGEELQSAIDRLRREAVERAKPIIDSTPKPIWMPDDDYDDGDDDESTQSAPDVMD